MLTLFLMISTISADADELTLNGLEPLLDDELALHRGGFRVTDDYIINIGLSITTTINGEDILNTNIANLVIENGNLTNLIANNNWNNSTNTTQLNQGLVNIIQLGDGNIIGDNLTHSPKLPNAQTPNIISSELLNSSIINIIQNTTDNNIIGLSTLVDIDAQVNGVIQQIRANQQLEDALLNHLN